MMYMNLSLTPYYLKSLLNIFNTKTISGFFCKIGTLLLAYFSPLSTLYHLLTFTVVVDFLLGIWAAKKRKENISSSKLSNSIVKLFIYILTLSLIYVFSMEVFFGDALVHIFMGIVILAELRSILENADDITGTNIFTQIFKKIKEFTEKKDKNDNNPPKDVTDHIDTSDPHSNTVI